MSIHIEIDKLAMRSLMADCIDSLINDKRWAARLSLKTERLLWELLEANENIKKGD